MVGIPAGGIGLSNATTAVSSADGPGAQFAGSTATGAFAVGTGSRASSDPAANSITADLLGLVQPLAMVASLVLIAIIILRRVL